MFPDWLQQLADDCTDEERQTLRIEGERMNTYGLIVDNDVKAVFWARDQRHAQQKAQKYVTETGTWKAYKGWTVDRVSKETY